MSNITFKVTNSQGQLSVYNNIDVSLNFQDIFVVEPPSVNTSNYNINYSYNNEDQTIYLMCNISEWTLYGTEKIESFLSLDDNVSSADGLTLNFSYIVNV
jgi:hypothetical protein